MRRLVVKLATLCAIVLVMMAGINYAVGTRIQKEEDLYYRLTYDELFRGKEKADLAIFGSSRAKHGINPRFLEGGGFRAFNFSLNGGGPTFLRKWYTQLFREYYALPRVVILEVNGFTFDPAVLWRRFEHDSLFMTSGALARAILNGGNSAPQLLLNRFPVFRERGNLGAMFAGGKPVADMSGYYKGFVPLHSTREAPAPPPARISVSQERLRDFEALLSELESEDVRVVLVQTPEHRAGVPEAAPGEALSLLRNLSLKRGIHYLDYNGELKSDINGRDELFWDPVHLNEKGSTEFSIRLGRDLKRILQG